jgi:AcrR family transcriptional regulator
VRQVTRARLLATAGEIFLSRGFAGTTVDAIAYEAGYTTGAVYSNFGGKADLFLAVLEHTTATQLAAVRAGLDEARTDEQRLEVFSTAIANEPGWQDRVAATIEFLSYARRHPELQARMRAAQQLADEAVGELLSALCRALGVEPPTPAHEIARDVNAIISGLAIRSLFDDQLDIGPAVSRAINALLTGDRSELLAIDA